MSAHQQARKTLDNMNAAMRHALDMNHNGTLDEKELDEFRKYIISTAIDDAPMEYHASAPAGTIDELRAASAPAEDDKRHPDDVMQDRRAIASKIVANFLDSAWLAGAIQDNVYRDEMQKIGRVPHDVQAARDGRAPGDKSEPPDDTLAIWGGQDEMNANPSPLRSRRTPSEEEMNAYVKKRKRQNKDHDDNGPVSLD